MTSALFTKVGMRPPEALELARSTELLRSETAAGVALGTGQAAALKVAPELLLHAQPVRVAFFDVDGVLTDGGLYMSEDGEILKRFNTLDGHGIKLLQKAGITPAIITGRDSPALRARLIALGITHAHFGTEDKWPAAEITLRALGLDWAAAAAMGDDWPDLPVMRRAAFSCAPANAHVEVKSQAHYVTQASGGHGAVRELCDLLLVATGRYASLLREYSR
jgi:3-deoxy-D-manno-octulosonate 8-phosphate phosphatase (KDO 8-P phosphatase)